MKYYHQSMDKRMFDFEDFYNRIAHEVPDKAVLAEIGVADGSSAIYLAEMLLGLNKTFRLYLVDNLAYGGQNQLMDLLRHIYNAGLEDVVDIIAMDSLIASCRFPDQLFDFVFIDASHKLEPTKADIRLWFEKVKHGGILAGHDYNEGEGLEVAQAVNAVIPWTTMPPIPADTQLPINVAEEPVLQVEQTTKEYNVWWLRRTPYLRLK